ncbi:pilus assembly protein [Halomonas sp. SpR8]|uniref:TadE/TadG family type IV pilus assembly protein n=1 Tax=Halomonas sp. SpR8 TaxID=3050463 RepID=UPI0027E42563|nr:pilus assembly protein [Halomonas sp. SpR8]MDQ7728170.1 pilus assembly protein [Halomonas sp. SpR8]
MYSKPKQRGAVAIEFAAIFMLFFALVYGAIAFGLPAVARLAFQHYSVEAARAAVQVDPTPFDAERPETFALVSSQVNSVISASWIPEDWRDGCADLDGTDGWSTLPDTVYGYWRPEPNPLPNTTPRYQVNVCIQTNAPIVPQLALGELRFPPYVDGDTGKSWVRGYTITTL